MIGWVVFVYILLGLGTAVAVIDRNIDGIVEIDGVNDNYSLGLAAFALIVAALWPMAFAYYVVRWIGK